MPTSGTWFFEVKRTPAPDESKAFWDTFLVKRSLSRRTETDSGTLQLVFEDTGGQFDDKERSIYVEVDASCLRFTTRKRCCVRAA